MDKVWLRDAAERIFWTAAQVIVGAVIIELSHIDATWALIIIPALTALKTAVAKKVGNNDSAALTLKK
jgi:hypothetical protein